MCNSRSLVQRLEALRARAPEPDRFGEEFYYLFYRDLVVRIGGYSDYFVTLSPQMQAEVIQRTAHSIG